MTSIRRRLLLGFLAFASVGWAVTMAAVWYQVSDEIEEVYDAHMIQTAHELGDMVSALLHLSDPGAVQNLPSLDPLLKKLSHPTEQNRYAATLSARIWWRGVPLHARGIGPSPPTPRQDGKVEVVHRHGQSLRRYAYFDATQQVSVEVTEQYNARTHIIDEVAQAATLPLLILLPLFGIAIWFAIGGGLHPLTRIVEGIRRRSPRDLTPLDLQNTPREIRPLIESLNQLFERLQQAMDHERRFTGDASHELRTPLAALRIQAQLALRTQDPQQREHALHQLLNGIDRSTHVVEQLLSLARLDSSLDHTKCSSIELRPLLLEQVQQVQALTRDKRVSLQVMDGDASVCGDEVTLMILLRNLLDNAIRYTPPDGQVRLACRVDGREIILEVADSGPGIPPDQYQTLLQRFTRGGDQAEAGCGLGLSIVQRVAEIHRARLELGQSSLGGLRAWVVFPKF